MADNYDIPYVDTTGERVAQMVRFSDVKPGQKTLDLGSGDGRVVIAMAKTGAFAHGIEIDPERGNTSRSAIHQAGLVDKASIETGSFWQHNLAPYDIITIYGVTSMMKNMQQKIWDEAKPGCKIISNYFQFPDWQEKDEQNSVYVYVMEPVAAARR